MSKIQRLYGLAPAFIVMGAPIVFVELGMVGITGSPGFLNKGG